MTGAKKRKLLRLVFRKLESEMEAAVRSMYLTGTGTVDVSAMKRDFKRAVAKDKKMRKRVGSPVRRPS